jgi:hypothetical protein
VKALATKSEALLKRLELNLLTKMAAGWASGYASVRNENTASNKTPSGGTEFVRRVRVAPQSARENRREHDNPSSRELPSNVRKRRGPSAVSRNRATPGRVGARAIKGTGMLIGPEACPSAGSSASDQVGVTIPKTSASRPATRPAGQWCAENSSRLPHRSMPHNEVRTPGAAHGNLPGKLACAALGRQRLSIDRPLSTAAYHCHRTRHPWRHG